MFILSVFHKDSLCESLRSNTSVERISFLIKQVLKSINWTTSTFTSLHSSCLPLWHIAAFLGTFQRTVDQCETIGRTLDRITHVKLRSATRGYKLHRGPFKVTLFFKLLSEVSLTELYYFKVLKKQQARSGLSGKVCCAILFWRAKIWSETLEKKCYSADMLYCTCQVTFVSSSQFLGKMSPL